MPPARPAPPPHAPPAGPLPPPSPHPPRPPPPPRAPSVASRRGPHPHRRIPRDHGSRRGALLEAADLVVRAGVAQQAGSAGRRRVVRRHGRAAPDSAVLSVARPVASVAQQSDRR